MITSSRATPRPATGDRLSQNKAPCFVFNSSPVRAGNLDKYHIGRMRYSQKLLGTHDTADRFVRRDDLETILLGNVERLNHGEVNPATVCRRPT